VTQGTGCPGEPWQPLPGRSPVSTDNSKRWECAGDLRGAGYGWSKRSRRALNSVGCSRFSFMSSPPSWELGPGERARLGHHQRTASGYSGKSLECVDGLGLFGQRGPHGEPERELGRLGDLRHAASSLVRAVLTAQRQPGAGAFVLSPSGYPKSPLGKMSAGSRRMRSSLVQGRSGSAVRRWACRRRAPSSALRTLRALANWGWVICVDR
jgi:hypothetical protein